MVLLTGIAAGAAPPAPAWGVVVEAVDQPCEVGGGRSGGGRYVFEER